MPVMMTMPIDSLDLGTLDELERYSAADSGICSAHAEKRAGCRDGKSHHYFHLISPVT
jgi:hypothetical protein